MLGEHDFRIVDTRATLDPDESSVATHGRDISPSGWNARCCRLASSAQS